MYIVLIRNIFHIIIIIHIVPFYPGLPYIKPNMSQQSMSYWKYKTKQKSYLVPLQGFLCHYNRIS